VEMLHGWELKAEMVHGQDLKVDSNMVGNWSFNVTWLGTESRKQHHGW